MPNRSPIAIVGIGCRYPGVSTPVELWRALCSGVDAVGEIPPSRWSHEKFFSAERGKPGKINAHEGAFIADELVRGFDWRAFRMSPREARHMDPQHRMLLEVAWEALEDAGIPFERIAGTETGVFVGLMAWNDYLVLQTNDMRRIDPYTAPGTDLAFAANRISYCFDLRGPSEVVEVGCASSLIAIRNACLALWSGAIDFALAGGANLMVGPVGYFTIHKAGIVSPDGRCKAFDARADGIGLGEAVGVMALKPLAAALRDHDRIYALIMGTSANHNGRTQWIQATDVDTQVKLMNAALADAGVDGSELDYVETHGTGTQMGDPVEAQAVSTIALGGGRATPCIIGSIKSNFGHTLGAAGVAAATKAALALHNGQIPPNVHLHTPNPAIDFKSLGISVPVELEPWPSKEGPRLAGVNSLSLGGANAHLILQEAPPQARIQAEPEQGLFHLYPVSACTKAALVEAIDRHIGFLAGLRESDEELLRDACYTAAVRRPHHAHRILAQGSTLKELIEDLTFKREQARQRQDNPATPSSRNLAWVFSAYRPSGRLLPPGIGQLGQPGQLGGVARELRELDAAIQELSGRDLNSTFAHLETTQQVPQLYLPVLASQIALIGFWKSWGLLPSTVMGTGAGVLAAAYAAGAATLTEVARLCLQLDGLLDGPSSTSRSLGSPTVPLLLARDVRLCAGDTLGEAQLRELVETRAETVDALSASGLGAEVTLIGMSPVATLTQAAAASVVEVDVSDDSQLDPRTLFRTLGSLYQRGAEIDWTAGCPSPRRVVSLPTYPWQRDELWIATTAHDLEPKLGGAERTPSTSAFEAHIEIAESKGLHVWTSRIAPDESHSLRDRYIRGQMLLPGAYFVAVVVTALEEMLGHEGSKVGISHLRFERPFLISAGRAVEVQLSIRWNPSSPNFVIHARHTLTESWQQCVSGELTVGAAPAPQTAQA